jgi:hypothetical protein
MQLFFVHMLLFECPGCGSPVATTLNSERRSLEETDKRGMTLRCGSCDQAGRFLGLAAKRHFVVEWEPGNGPQAKTLLPQMDRKNNNHLASAHDERSGC